MAYLVLFVNSEGVFLLEFCNGGKAQKTSVSPTRRWKEFDDVCINFNTTPESGGQETDEQIYHNNLAVCMLTRDKNDNAVLSLEA